jgi:hypothetical protein
MGRIGTPAAASCLPRGRLFAFTSWLQRWREPLPLVGLDVGALDMFWVELGVDAGQVRITQALREPLPAGWGRPQDVASWDLAVLGEALARLKARRVGSSAAPRYLAMGLSAEDVQFEALEAGLSAHPQLAQAQTLADELYWDVAQRDDGAQLITTPRATALTLQALAESVGFELAVLETSEAALVRAELWLHQQGGLGSHLSSQDIPASELSHNATAIGLALRRFEPWGTAC